MSTVRRWNCLRPMRASAITWMMSAMGLSMRRPPKKPNCSPLNTLACAHFRCRRAARMLWSNLNVTPIRLMGRRLSGSPACSAAFLMMG